MDLPVPPPVPPPVTPPVTLPLTVRTRVTRLPDRQVTDRAALHDVLDQALVASVATCVDGRPVVLPMACARDRERLLLHGSTGGGVLRALAAGAEVSVCVTHVDGLVFAGSLFDSSMDYRSAVVFGRPEVVRGAEAVRALEVLSEHLMPGRWSEVPAPTPKQLAATVVLAVPLDEASVKVRRGGPGGGPGGAAGRQLWTGVLPIGQVTGEPVAADGLPQDVPVPGSVTAAAARFTTAARAARRG